MCHLQTAGRAATAVKVRRTSVQAQRRKTRLGRVGQTEGHSTLLPPHVADQDLISMPSGRVKWFDLASHEARVVARSGREYPAAAGELEPPARTADASVTFKVRKQDGVARAVEVRLRGGTRVSPTQGRFGDLGSARHPDAKGREPLARRRSETGLDAGEPLSRVALHWVDALFSGDRTAVMLCYAPDCVIHAPSGTGQIGRKAVQEYMDRSPLLGSRHDDVRIREIASRVRVSWRLNAGDQVRVPVSERQTQATLRIEHGQIAEQWG